MRLAGVLDHRQSRGASAISRIGVHVGRLAVEVHRQIALVRGVIAALELRRVHREGDRVDVDEDRPRAGVADRRHGGDEGERDGDDLVAGADAGGEQRQCSALVPVLTAIACVAPQ